MTIEELVKKYWDEADFMDRGHFIGALTEQAEAFNGELQSYDGTVRELQKTVEDMQAAQSVPVVGEVAGWQCKHGGSSWFTESESRRDIHIDAGWAVTPLIVQPAHSIPAAELATLREKAAMVDELRKRAERMQKALSDIAEWTDRYTTPGHPVSTIASAAIAQGSGGQSTAQGCAKVCTNCDTALPEGCGGIFRGEGAHCELNSQSNTVAEAIAHGKGE